MYSKIGSEHYSLILDYLSFSMIFSDLFLLWKLLSRELPPLEMFFDTMVENDALSVLFESSAWDLTNYWLNRNVLS